MGRLIDADKLKSDFDEVITFIEKDCTKDSISKEEFCKCLKIIRTCVDEQPTAYDIEKVVAELEVLHDLVNVNQKLAVSQAIEIVKRGGAS